MRKPIAVTFVVLATLIACAYLAVNAVEARLNKIIVAESRCTPTELVLKRVTVYLVVRCENNESPITEDHSEIYKFFRFSSVLHLRDKSNLATLTCSITYRGHVINCR